MHAHRAYVPSVPKTELTGKNNKDETKYNHAMHQAEELQLLQNKVSFGHMYPFSYSISIVQALKSQLKCVAVSLEIKVRIKMV